jgi:hypothetical protein
VVECTGLENRRTARYRGFESLHLRNIEKSQSVCFGIFCAIYILSAKHMYYFSRTDIGPADNAIHLTL